MSDDSETKVDEVLGDQQRIELLEKSAKLSRLLIYGLAGGLVLLLLTVILFALLGGGDEPEEKEPPASKASVAALEKRLVAVEQQVATFEQQLKNQQALIALAASSPPAPAPASATAPTAPAAPAGPDRATIRQVASVLIGQEQNYQQSITALKNGMRDLAGMIAGSRSWLEDYESDLNKPLGESQARVKALQKWASGKSTSQAE